MRLPPLSVLIVCLLAAPLAAQDADSAAVEEVDFAGVRALDEALLRNAVETRESACASPFYAPFCAVADADWAERRAFLDTAALRRDEEAIRRTYALWGFPDASAGAAVDTLDDGDVRVRFTVVEGAPVRVRNVLLRGAESLPSLTAASLPIHPGDVYALPRIQAAQRVVARRFGERGHAFVQVQAPPQPVEGALADVVIDVTPGPAAVFGPTNVRAEAPLEGGAARRRLPYRPGQRFSPALLEHAVERLYGLPIVDSVDIRPAPVAWSDSVVEVNVAVGTGKAARYELEGVVGASRCLGAQGFVSHGHAFGAPRVLTLSASASNLLASELCGRDESGEFTEPAYTLRASLAEPVGRASWLLLEGGLRARRVRAARVAGARGLGAGSGARGDGHAGVRAGAQRQRGGRRALLRAVRRLRRDGGAAAGAGVHAGAGGGAAGLGAGGCARGAGSAAGRTRVAGAGAAALGTVAQPDRLRRRRGDGLGL